MSEAATGSRLPATGRGRRTRDNLVGAATQLFAEHGVDGVTVDEICVAAGVAKGTFYVHFKQKEDVLFAGFASAMETVAARVAGWVDDGLPVREVLERFAGAMGWVGEVDPRLVTVTVGEFLARPGDFLSYQTASGLPRDVLAPVVSAGQERGELRRGATAEDVAGLLETVWMGTVLRWAQQGGDRQLEGLLVAQLDLVLRGLEAGR